MVKVTTSWVCNFAQVSWWLGKNCGFFINSQYLSLYPFFDSPSNISFLYFQDGFKRRVERYKLKNIIEFGLSKLGLVFGSCNHLHYEREYPYQRKRHQQGRMIPRKVEIGDMNFLTNWVSLCMAFPINENKMSQMNFRI